LAWALVKARVAPSFGLSEHIIELAADRCRINF
jgi:hypothetical protein